MKRKLSITIEEKSVEKIEDFVKEGSFRNKSHLIEYAVTNFLKEEGK